ncbi:type II/IV secretion system protein TadC [Vibrio variabilis]|uniref:Type II/IV secretion system protein TadC n=1 Tax=Vibrio variabilis TaxID=990271 RepID=A0ABQ0JLH2_9VIBR|nr:type II/IV secretion system protein TadC [Vibrio variabilis]
MILPMSIAFIIIAVAFLTYELVVASKRKHKLEGYIMKNQPVVPLKTNRIIIGFAKEQRKELEQKLLDAGYYNKNLARYYMPFKLLCAALIGAMVFFLIDTDMVSKLVAVFASVVLAMILPDFVLEARKRYMVRKISRNLPYLLDMMSVCVQTGMTIEASFAYLHKELAAFDKDLCYQVKKNV